MDKVDSINSKLKKAVESLESAEVLIHGNFQSGAVNRLYYACFYAASALLLCKDINVKSHAGVLKMLGLHFVQPGILSKETGRYYAELLMYRQDSDYNDFLILEPDFVVELKQKATLFINQSIEIIKH